MKRIEWVKKVLVAAVATAVLLSTVVFADHSKKQPNEVSVDERETITLDEVLLKLNSGRTPEELYSDLPYDDDIEIIDFSLFEYEEPERFYTEYMTESEILELIDRIANGENVMFGDSVTYPAPAGPEESSESRTADNSGTRWKAGSTYPTHQWLLGRGLTILGNDYSSIKNKFSSAQITILANGVDGPDENSAENEWTYNNHFYHYPSGTNYWWNYINSKTAKSKFVYWYGEAVSHYLSESGVGMYATNYRNQAFEKLAYAIHYLADLGAPPHTGDRSFWPGAVISPIFTIAGGLYDAVQAGKHSDYEVDAHNVRTSYAVTSASYYTWYKNSSTSNIAETNASISYGYYSGAYSSNATTRQNAMKYPLQFTQQDIAGILYKFYLDTNNLCYN